MCLSTFLDQERSYKICILVQRQLPTVFIPAMRAFSCKIQEFLVNQEHHLVCVLQSKAVNEESEIYEYIHFFFAVKSILFKIAARPAAIKLGQECLTGCSE